VSGAQAAGLRGGRAALHRLVLAGSLVPECGVYRLAEHARSPETRLWARVLSTRGVLSHRTAAIRLGASLPGPTIEVTVVSSRNPTPLPDTTIHRSRRLPAGHVVRDEDGLPHTSAPRTLVDLAATTCGLGDEELLACLDAWIVDRRVTLGWLEWFLAVEARGLPGRTRALALVKAIAGVKVDSAAERALSSLLYRSGLRPFETQYLIYRAGVVVARVDFAWPQKRVALELDGYRYHSGPGVFVADRQRGNEVELAGWRLLRTTPAEIRTDPGRLVATVRDALDLLPRLNEADKA
jgi:very-short-patch-repair endonuclease